MMHALHACLQVSVQSLVDTDPVCLKLFFLLSMLPGGVTEDELTQYWQAID
jgi:hypothetical protein